MKLPVLGSLNENESTYITFSKALADLDEAVSNGSVYYFSKVVAMKLPVWSASGFHYNPTEVGVDYQNKPNICFPKMIQHYMENILRQNITSGGTECPQHAEIAFYKTLNKMGMSANDIKNSIVFANDIVTSSYNKAQNNNGWSEIVCQIPGNCCKFIPAFKTVLINNTVSTSDGTPENNEQKPIYDNASKQYSMSGFNFALNFGGSTYDTNTQANFEFNVLLLFYVDETGVEKLHGINFIYPWTQNGSEWHLENFKKRTNNKSAIGYQFLFNMKTCYNDNTKVQIINQHNAQAMWWNGWSETLGRLGDFLETKAQERDWVDSQLNGTIPHVN